MKNGTPAPILNQQTRDIPVSDFFGYEGRPQTNPDTDTVTIYRVPVSVCEGLLGAVGDMIIAHIAMRFATTNYTISHSETARVAREAREAEVTASAKRGASARWNNA